MLRFAYSSGEYHNDTRYLNSVQLPIHGAYYHILSLSATRSKRSFHYAVVDEFGNLVPSLNNWSRGSLWVTDSH